MDLIKFTPDGRRIESVRPTIGFNAKSFMFWGGGLLAAGIIWHLYNQSQQGKK